MVKLNILTSSILLLAGYASALPTLDSLLSEGELAPLYHSPDAEAITDSYIVVLKDQVNTSQVQEHCDWVHQMSKRDALSDYLDAEAAAGLKHTYATPGWRGYAGKFSPETLKKIRSSPDVRNHFMCHHPQSISHIHTLYIHIGCLCGEGFYHVRFRIAT